MLVLSASREIGDPFYSGTLAPLPQQSIRRLGASSSYEAAAIRLLMGCADIADGSGSVIVMQRKNYFVLGCPRVRVRSETGVGMSLIRLGVGWRELDKHLRSTLTHQSYFREVLAELVEYFVRTKSGAHTLAFLHAYRLLERMSFVFPLLFAVRSSNYPGAFTALKEYFKGGTESELTLLRKFQDDAIDLTTREATCILDFGVLGGAVMHTSFDVAKRCISPDDIKSDVSPRLEVKSQALLSLLINVRNRYFHYSVSNSANVSTREFGDSDGFFAVLNAPIMNWLGVIFLSVLSERVR